MATTTRPDYESTAFLLWPGFSVSGSGPIALVCKAKRNVALFENEFAARSASAMKTCGCLRHQFRVINAMPESKFKDRYDR